MRLHFIRCLANLVLERRETLRFVGEE
jgi:hypothetical protein